MKYVFIPYIALGLVLATLVGVEYNFVGNEMMPRYWGSPFVYKVESLASSLEWYYSVSGLVLNVLLWSAVLYFVHKSVKKFIQSKPLKIAYKVIIGFFVAFSSLNVWFDYVTMGNGFSENLNYWYWDIDQIGKDWGGKYEGKVVTFRK